MKQELIMVRDGLLTVFVWYGDYFAPADVDPLIVQLCFFYPDYIFFYIYLCVRVCLYISCTIFIIIIIIIIIITRKSCTGQ